jgi:hypothetical protein
MNYATKVSEVSIFEFELLVAINPQHPVLVLKHASVHSHAPVSWSDASKKSHHAPTTTVVEKAVIAGAEFRASPRFPSQSGRLD